MAFEKVIDSGQAKGYKFESIGARIEGYYLGTTKIKIDDREVAKHLFQTKAGVLSVLGQAHLTNLLSDVSKGTMVRVTLTGSKKTKPGRHPMNVFEVEFDKAQTISVAPDAEDTSYASQDEDFEETSLDSEEAPMDEVPFVAPKRAATPSKPAGRASVEALLSGKARS